MKFAKKGKQTFSLKKAGNLMESFKIFRYTKGQMLFYDNYLKSKENGYD